MSLDLFCYTHCVSVSDKPLVYLQEAQLANYRTSEGRKNTSKWSEDMHRVLFKTLIMYLYNLLLKMKSQEAINFEVKVCVWRIHFQL